MKTDKSNEMSPPIALKKSVLWSLVPPIVIIRGTKRYKSLLNRLLEDREIKKEQHGVKNLKDRTVHSVVCCLPLGSRGLYIGSDREGSGSHSAPCGMPILHFLPILFCSCSLRANSGSGVLRGPGEPR